MRFPGSVLIVLLLLAGLASSPAAELPEFRPALPGTGPTALVNKIDTAELMAKGQKTGTVMFCSRISATGVIAWSKTYLVKEDSQILKGELEKALQRVTFFPAIYQHNPVDVIYYGTVTFTVVEGKPRLRIFANQDPKELKDEKDFITPQPIFGGASPFKGMNYPENISVVLNGIGYLSLKVDEKGNLQDLQVVGEEPPLSGFGDVAAADFAKAKFIPAFRDGSAVESTVTLPVYYVPETDEAPPSLFPQ